MRRFIVAPQGMAAVGGDELIGCSQAPNPALGWQVGSGCGHARQDCGAHHHMRNAQLLQVVQGGNAANEQSCSNQHGMESCRMGRQMGARAERRRRRVAAVQFGSAPALSIEADLRPTPGATSTTPAGCEWCGIAAARVCNSKLRCLGAASQRAAIV